MTAVGAAVCVGLKLYQCVCVQVSSGEHIKDCDWCAAPLGEQVAVEDVEHGHGRTVEEQEICGQQRGGGGRRR